MKSHYVIGLDYGTNSARAVVVNVNSGEEVATSIWNYTHGEAGVIIDQKDTNLARQHPQDYIDGAGECVRQALREAAQSEGFSADRVIGIGIDTTGSTPMPVDAHGAPLALNQRFQDEPAAMAWLWKDHTGHAEAEEITERAARLRPHYLAKCGGRYSSEWFWSKILHCQRAAPAVADAAHTWVEIADWIPALLTGTMLPSALKRGICAAGHKAMFNASWGGYPDEEFLTGLDTRLARVRRALPNVSHTVAEAVGGLSAEWAAQLGLREGLPVAVGAFDAHLGAAGSGIRPGVLVKIIGTSTCDMMVWPLEKTLPDIPGLCGIVPESVLPGAYGLEAGQSAVGDIFNWFVNQIQHDAAGGGHEALSREAAMLSPGESGLLGLDWHNGNRTILTDQRLTGLLAGMTLHTSPSEIYRALIESTAFGARVIMERFEEYGLKVERIVNCGGISVKNPLVMQIYADVMNRTLEISRSTQTCALGAAMAGAVVAGRKAGGHGTFGEAAAAMTGLLERKFTPNPKSAAVYDRLYRLFHRVHDSFGVAGTEGGLYDVMKELLEIRDKARGHGA
ncbi:MAG: ribulokinase [Candidatus Sumerlaeota bacterium]|nr:ribulokinase [Candidatus Sumerlaeota bacterium]